VYAFSLNPLNGKKLSEESIAVVKKDRVVGYLYRINPVYTGKKGDPEFSGYRRG
jgi:hypothetical protein